MTEARRPLDGIPLASPRLDRAAIERADAGLIPALLADSSSRVLELRGGAAHIRRIDGPARLEWRAPLPGDLDPSRTVAFLGRDKRQRGRLTVFDIADEPVREPAFTAGGVPTPGWYGLRTAGASLRRRDAGSFATALALWEWHRTHRFCAHCGQPTQVVAAGWIRRCVVDGREHYPASHPSIIVSVIDEQGRLLLGRGASWPPGRFSVIAGFVEPGESFEAAVAREVFEETGIRVANPRFMGSQPWPFPASLMVGYSATAETTAIRADPVEMAEVVWVSREEYLALLGSGAWRSPTGFSIAVRLIERWLGQPIPRPSQP